MASITLKEYKKSFDEQLDALKYLNTYYDPSDHSTYDINTQHIIDAISVLTAHRGAHNGVKGVQYGSRGMLGGKVLEVGCGPYIGNSLVESQFFEEIYPSDYNLAMLTPLKKWVAGENVGFDNQYMINFVANQVHKAPEELAVQTLNIFLKKWVAGENVGFDNQYMINFVANQVHKAPEELAVQTVNKVKEFLVSDVHKRNPLGEKKMSFDAIVTRFCIDSCSPDLESYKQAIRNVLSLLKKGGLFLQMGFFNHGDGDITQGYWDIGNTRFQDVRLPKSDVQNSVQEAGMKIVQWRERIHQSNDEDAFLNTSSYTMLAIKE